jgi:chemotaxis signal transduction protein
MELAKSFCLFDGDAGPMAVSVESVAAVLEEQPLVRLVWSPPHVVGLCPYRREVVPVISFGSIESHRWVERASEAKCRPGAGALAHASHEVRGDKTACAVLILRTEHDDWGLRIGHAGTLISRESPDLRPARHDEDGLVWIGSLRRGETRYTVFDAAATWRALRSAIARSYALANEHTFNSSISSDEASQQAGTRTTD